MTPIPEVQDRLRHYLLGQLADDARDEFEKELLTSDDLYQELLIVEDEMVDEYLSGKLGSEDRAAFEQHFLATPERHEKLRFGRAFNRYLSSHAATTGERRRGSSASPRAWTQTLFSSPLRIAVAVIIVVGVALGVWRVFFNQSEVDKGLLALNAAYREQRPIQARISKLDYAPYSSTRGSGDEKVDQNDLSLAELTLRRELKNRPTPAARHALGKVFLAKKEFDKAIEQFDEALKGDPKNAQLYSDLGAAWLEKGRIERSDSESGKGPEAFARSLNNLNKALDLNANLLEALFNRAYVHESQMLLRQAEEDWREYIKKDSTSPWAIEAQRNLKLLQDRVKSSSQTNQKIRQDFRSAFEAQNHEQAWQVISRSRDTLSVGRQIRDQLLDELLRASSQDANNEINSILQALTFAGKVEFEKTGDAYTTELSRFYQSATQHQRETLIQARELMILGQEQRVQAKPLKALVTFQKSQNLFATIGDRWESQYAELWIAYCHLNATQSQRSVVILQRLASSFERENYKWLNMRALHLLSGAMYDLSEYSKAIEYNRRALALAEHMQDQIGMFNALSILIEQYRYIGNYGQSLACVQRSLTLIESCPLNEIQIAQHYGMVASVLSSAGFLVAAGDYQKEAVSQALNTGQIQTLSRAYANLGSLYGKMGNYDEALKNAKLAYDTAKSHSDDRVKRWLMAYASSQIGDLYRQNGDTARAIASFDECLELNQSLGNYYGLYEAHKNRLFCFITNRDDAAAKEELKTTLGLVEKYRAQINEGDNRNHFFDLEQNVYDLAIDFEYSRMANSERAFEYSEASRARALLDLVNSKVKVSTDRRNRDVVFASPTQPLKRREIQERITPPIQIVQYAVLSDKLLIWVITKTKFSSFETKVTQEQLTQKVFAYLKTISSRSRTLTTSGGDEAKQLFEILFKPVEPYLQSKNPVFVVPDKVLNYLPFGALLSPDSNRFLVEDYLTVVSPSSSLLVISTDAARRKEAQIEERLLSVGNPSFDRSEFPELADLPSAETETRKISTYYKANCLLNGDLARKPRVQYEMERADIIHFAVHSFFDQHSPLRSKLLLAASERPSRSEEPLDSVLEASEIYRMNLSRARVVVLSACQSGIEQYYGGEGMISLARPFLAASVPLVIASLWPVDSDSTAELMIGFHQHRKQDNLTSAEALRRAQLDMLGSPDQRLNQPYSWASFTAVGGSTSF